ncbi:hypothetical protein HDU86_000175 [Geranomyces michiganensis]|nr:hypothetical protein HDU86_000175 [Geranomyces michiganensis]
MLLLARTHALRSASTTASRIALPSSSVVAVRTLYKKPVLPPAHYTKPEIDEKVLEMLFDYTSVPHQKVTLEANITRDLAVGRLDRFGLFWELQTEFELNFPPTRNQTRDLASGREAADWIAANLEEAHRLKF